MMTKKATILRPAKAGIQLSTWSAWAMTSFDFRPGVAIHRRHPSDGWDLTSSNEAPEAKERSQLPLG